VLIYNTVYLNFYDVILKTIKVRQVWNEWIGIIKQCTIGFYYVIKKINIQNIKFSIKIQVHWTTLLFKNIQQNACGYVRA
jgi:hypothetical protein